MIRSLILSFLLIFTLSSTAEAKFLTLNEIGEASCRVRVSNSAGSGTSVSEDEEHIYVLTNAHVVGNNQRATCEFFRYGRKTGLIPGDVVWTSYDTRTVNDFAIIRIRKSYFGRYLPRIVPLAPAGHTVQENDYIASAGCPQARWLQLWEGHALSKASRNQVLFTPPPLGGQSGSGVYTLIKGHTYLCAILTWRVDEDIGGAIHIGNFLRASKGEASAEEFQKVPASWKHISTKTETPTKNVPKACYALGENGIYYMQEKGSVTSGFVQSVVLPAGHLHVKIKKWNCWLWYDGKKYFFDKSGPFIRCPGGICPPIIDPPTPTPPNGEGVDKDNPYGILPPNWEGHEDKTEEYEKAIEDLKKQVTNLSKEKKDLLSQMESLNTEKKDLSSNIDSLKVALEEKIATLSNLNNRLEDLKSKDDKNIEEIEGLNEQINILNSDISLGSQQVEGLQESLDKKSRMLDGLLGDYNQLDGEVKEVKSQRNLFAWLFGGTSTGGILVWLFSWYWKLRGKRKAKDMIEDKLDPEKVTDAINDKIDRVQEEKLGQNHALNGIVDYLQERLESVIEDKIGSLSQSLQDKIDKIEVSAKDIDVSIYNTIDDRDEVKISSDTGGEEIPVIQSPSAKEALDNQDKDKDKDGDRASCACDTILDYIKQPSFPAASSRIKEFIDLKRCDGERVEELAFYAHLYKEAIDLLKRNSLIVIKGGSPDKLHGQIKAGEALEDHVRNEFLRRVSSSTINRHIIYHEAMIGFLYKQAVVKLKRGEFNVLGYKDIAKAIEQWVKTEFLKRMGFTL